MRYNKIKTNLRYIMKIKKEYKNFQNDYLYRRIEYIKKECYDMIEVFHKIKRRKEELTLILEDMNTML